MGESFLIKRAGGVWAKATDAILRVQAQIGATVTITKDGVTKVRNGIVSADDNSKSYYYFVIHANQFDGITPWTVTGTIGNYVLTDSIIIDSADEYTLKLDYVLYNRGTQYLPFDIRVSSATSGSFEEGYVQTYTASVNGGVSVATTNMIDLTDFNAIKVEIDVEQIGRSDHPCQIVASTYYYTYYDPGEYVACTAINTASAGTIQTVTADISAVSGNYYVVATSGFAQVKLYSCVLCY